MQKFKNKNENFIKNNKDYNEMDMEQSDDHEDDEHCIICLNKLESLKDCVYFSFYSYKNILVKQYSHFSSCKHYCHFSCYSKFIEQIDDENKTPCPKCNRVFNIDVLIFNESNLTKQSAGLLSPNDMRLEKVNKQLNDIQLDDKMEVEIDDKVNDFYNKIVQLIIKNKYDSSETVDENHILTVVEDFIMNEL